ncbi:MAG: cation transporter, partial [Caulobacteraceae bacterium]|nr:cation transporter [Caulobacter sp.]
MAEGSKVAVYAALAGNVAIAVVKFTAAALTRSTAMLTEGVHSLVDSLDQVLLLVGQARGGKAPDESHPLGYGLEVYFWTFVVSLMVFLAGGLFSAYEGVQKLAHGGEADQPWINYLVLAVSALFEGLSFAVGWREYRKASGGRLNVFRYIRASKDPNIMV